MGYPGFLGASGVAGWGSWFDSSDVCRQNSPQTEQEEQFFDLDVFRERRRQFPAAETAVRGPEMVRLRKNGEVRTRGWQGLKPCGSLSRGLFGPAKAGPCYKACGLGLVVSHVSRARHGAPGLFGWCGVGGLGFVVSHVSRARHGAPGLLWLVRCGRVDIVRSQVSNARPGAPRFISAITKSQGHGPSFLTV